MAAPRHPGRRARRIERVLAVVALLTVVAAWIVGSLRSATDVAGSLHEVVPGADHFTARVDGSFVAWGDAQETELLGHVRLAVADGYGGPLEMAVALDPSGEILGLAWVTERETPTLLQKVRRSGLPGSLVGKSHDHAFVVGQDVDGVSGATLTVGAVTGATRAACREIAAADLGLPVAPQAPAELRIGIPEVVVVLLLLVGLWGNRARAGFRKALRWASLLTGLVVLGFAYNDPLTLADVQRLLLGYWPSWRTDLYWYLLVGGVLLIVLARRKSPYCSWFCPFGAAQECLGALGGARFDVSLAHRETFLWVQRGLAWLAIVLGLLLRNPALSSYEVFGGLFDLVGTSAQFLVLAVVLIAALFIKRPWCRLLCPLRPVTDFLILLRNWSRESWQRIKPAGSAQ